jgi:hypothetical protein
MREVGMQVTAKADYAVRAATALASAGPGPVKSERIAVAEGIPLRPRGRRRPGRGRLPDVSPLGPSPFA